MGFETGKLYLMLGKTELNLIEQMLTLFSPLSFKIDPVAFANNEIMLKLQRIVLEIILMLSHPEQILHLQLVRASRTFWKTSRAKINYSKSVP